MKHIPLSRYKYSLFVLTILSITYSTFLIIQFKRTNNAAEQIIVQDAQASSQIISHNLNSFIEQLKPLVHALADELGSRKMGQQEIEHYLQKKPLSVFNFGVAFAPYQFDKNKKLYGPCVTHEGDKKVLVHLENTYDYTTDYKTPNHAWFTLPLSNISQFSSPYLDPISNTILVTYTTPFYDPADHTTPAGVIFASQSMNHIEHLLKQQVTDYWFITARDGTIYSHPYKDLVQQHTNILDFALQHNNTALWTIINQQLNNSANNASSNYHNTAYYNNQITGARSLLISNLIPTTDWLLHIVIADSEPSSQHTATRKKITFIQIYLTISLLLMLTYFLFFILSVSVSPWLISLLYSLILIASIGSFWHIKNRYPDYQHTITVVKNETELQTVISPTTPLPEQKTNFNRIPTGIYITDIAFKTSSDIEVVCYIWQRYSLAHHQQIKKGFILPRATYIKKHEISRRITSTHETIVWEVRATIGQSLRYETYPFDQKTLTIKIWPQDFDNNIILVPDFDSYYIKEILAQPGLSQDISITDWQVIGSFFGYNKKEYHTSFGAYDTGLFGSYNHTNKSLTPELSFNITIKRFLSNILTNELLPIIVLALFLFITLFTLADFTIFVSYATLFFTAIFLHIGFNEKIKFEKVVYLESFFLILYLVIFVLTLISLAALFNQKFKEHFLNKANILYWPLLLTVVTIITIWYLY